MGIALWIRMSSVISPPRSGTFRSHRTSTRRPLTSRSSNEGSVVASVIAPAFRSSGRNGPRVAGCPQAPEASLPSHPRAPGGHGVDGAKRYRSRFLLSRGPEAHENRSDRPMRPTRAIRMGSAVLAAVLLLGACSGSEDAAPEPEATPSSAVPESAPEIEAAFTAFTERSRGWRSNVGSRSPSSRDDQVPRRHPQTGIEGHQGGSRGEASGRASQRTRPPLPCPGREDPATSARARWPCSLWTSVYSARVERPSRN